MVSGMLAQYCNVNSFYKQVERFFCLFVVVMIPWSLIEAAAVINNIRYICYILYMYVYTLTIT